MLFRSNCYTCGPPIFVRDRTRGDGRSPLVYPCSLLCIIAGLSRIICVSMKKRFKLCWICQSQRLSEKTRTSLMKWSILGLCMMMANSYPHWPPSSTLTTWAQLIFQLKKDIIDKLYSQRLSNRLLKTNNQKKRNVVMKFQSSLKTRKISKSSTIWVEFPLILLF